MKAKEIIIESLDDKIEEIRTSVGLPKSEAKIAIEIGKECKPFLKAINYDVFNFLLYRGIGSRDADFFTANVKLDNRKPKDIPQHAHNLLNDYFTEQFGEPFRNSLFTSHSYSDASEYGNVYAIFPKGKFTFCWSSKYSDLLDLWRKFSLGVDSQSDNVDKNFMDNVADGDYQTSNLQKAIESNNEIMIRCQSAFAFNAYIVENELSIKQMNAMIQIMRMI